MTPDENVGAETVAELFNGQLSIAGSADFAPTQISSFNGGEWQTGTALLDAPENPGMSYFTFDLEPDGQPFGLEYGSEVKLFKFKNDFGGCPDSLYIVGSFRPIGIEENRLDGQATQLTGTNETAFGGIYGHEAWTCEILIGGGFPFEVGTDSLGMGDDSSKFFAAGGKTDWMTLAPNPASDFVEVKISPENTENQPIVRLLSLQGQTLHTCLADGQNTLRIDLNHLPAGLYFLSLEAGGQVVQYEKLVKK